MTSRYDINALPDPAGEFLDEISADLDQGLRALANVMPCVTIYGSSRVRTDDPVYAQTEALARALAEQGFSIVTGGGPGVMEAANKGARLAGAPSVGINVWFPNEQRANSYATVALQLRHLFVRKLLLIRYAQAVIFMPGGYGTLDELFETLTLIQTERLRPVPVLLFGSDHWNPLVAWIRGTLLAHDFIRPADDEIFQVVDTVPEVLDRVTRSAQAARPEPLSP